MKFRTLKRLTKTAVAISFLTWFSNGTYAEYKRMINTIPQSKYDCIQSMQQVPAQEDIVQSTQYYEPPHSRLEEIMKEKQKQREELRRQIQETESILEQETLNGPNSQVPEQKYLRLKNWTKQDREKAIEALYAEARSQYQNEDYLRNVASTFITRAIQREKPVNKVIKEPMQYSYLNKRDSNKVKPGKINTLLKKSKIEQQAYITCQQIIDEIIENGVDENKAYTHYFVRPKNSKDIPKWARGIKPAGIIEHGNDITRFYNIQN